MTIERRWREGGGDATDDRIGAMLRQVADPPPLGEERLDRVAAALAGAPRRSRRRLPALRWAVVGTLVLGTGGVVFARHEIARLWEVVTRPEAPAAPGAAERLATPRPVAKALAPMPEPEKSVEMKPSSPAPSAAWGRSGGGRRSSPIVAADLPRAPAPSQPPPPADGRGGPEISTPIGDRLTRATPLPSDEMLAPVPVSSAPPSSAPAPAPAPPPPGLGDEARLLRRALEELRHARDALAALAALDEHRARFPAGLLRADADILRVDVLLALDRDDDALALLQRLDLSTSPRADELRVTRGELRAGRDCGRALDDFDRVLGGVPPPAVLERALRGRAVCWLRLADEQRAQAALRAYLERFPGGPFAAEARRRLQAPR